MCYQEKKTIVSIIGSVVIFGIYFMVVFQQYQEGNFDSAIEYMFWAKALLILIPVQIVAKIVIHIMFTIINSITTKDCDPELIDEMDKLIELKAMRNSYISFMLGFLISIGLVLMGKPLSIMFILFAVSMTFGCVIGDISQLYFYRKGV